ncbi:MAG: hypothetical protein ACPGKV_16600 [Alteromonas macleodii]
MKCEELTQIELEYVSGGFRNFMFGYLVSKAMDLGTGWRRWLES